MKILDDLAVRFTIEFPHSRLVDLDDSGLLIETREGVLLQVYTEAGTRHGIISGVNIHDEYCHVDLPPGAEPQAFAQLIDTYRQNKHRIIEWIAEVTVRDLDVRRSELLQLFEARLIAFAGAVRRAIIAGALRETLREGGWTYRSHLVCETWEDLARDQAFIDQLLADFPPTPSQP